MNDHAPLTEYEQERAARMAANKARLQELMAIVAVPPPRSFAAERKPPRSQRRAEHLVAPERASARLAATPRASMREPDAPRARSSSSASSPAQRARTRGRYNVPGATSCHACRQCTDALKAACSSCPSRWCAPCLCVKLGADANTLNASGVWRCPRCRGDCPCSGCRRAAGKQPLGILAHAARRAGFACVADYQQAMLD